jgi:single-stranded-DNA-specific exonuclease
VARAITPCSPPPVTLVGEDGAYLDRALAELDGALAAPPEPPAAAGRVLRDRRGRGIAATVVELVGGAEPVLVVCAAAPERCAHLSGRLGGFALCSYSALERDRELTSGYTHVVLLDPPTSERQLALAGAGEGTQFTHLAWGEPELRFALHILEREYGLRGSLAACYRALRDSGGAAGRELEVLLRGDRSAARSPELAGRLLRVLTELDLIVLDRSRQAASVTEVRRAALETSPAYRTYQQRLQDGLRYLEPNQAQVA